MGKILLISFTIFLIAGITAGYAWDNNILALYWVSIFIAIGGLFTIPILAIYHHLKKKE